MSIRPALQLHLRERRCVLTHGLARTGTALRAEKGGKKKADNLQTLLDAIAALDPAEKKIAATVHQIVMEVAPDLAPRLWYGMPAYEKDGSVLLFLQLASKFDTRYATLGFNDGAQLDDGELWPTHFAVPRMTDQVRTRITELVTAAVAPSP